jgi:hypothetical protein
MFRSFIFGLFVALPLLWSACNGSKTRPDLKHIYEPLARQHHADQNPIVVIPGIMGSRLVQEKTGTVVWGAFGGGAADPLTPAGARLVALPMRVGLPLSALRDEVQPAGVLDQVKVTVAGLPFYLDAYRNILAMLGVGGYRDQSLGLSGAVDYGEKHYTCFQFDYDWRRDIAENARRLDNFLREKRAYVHAERQKRRNPEQRIQHREEEIRFDVVAHSLGGLVLRYFLRFGMADPPALGSAFEVPWLGAPIVERAILVGAPNAGSMHALDRLVHGARFSSLISAYPAALVGTFPVMYQLLPRGQHGVLVEEADPNRQLTDLLDPALWTRLGWGLASKDAAELIEHLLPDVAEPAERRRIALDHLHKSLARAKRIQQALDAPAAPPEFTKLYLFAGDAESTPARAKWHAKAGRLEMIHWAPGDGTVTRASALLDERSQAERNQPLVTPIAWRQVIFLFTDHLGMTRDPIFDDNVLYLLLEAPR